MIHNPHDALFKGVLGKPEHALGVLRTLVPAPLAEALDWQTLTLCHGSFVDEALQEQHTDLLYSTTWRDGGEVLVDFLFEHQSAPPKDGLMAYRLLRYQVRIWDDWHAKHPKEKTLPMIIPVVMYHGTAPWSEPRLFGDLLAVPPSVRPAVAPYLVQLAYLLDDLSQISDDELRDGAMRTALATRRATGGLTWRSATSRPTSTRSDSRPRAGRSLRRGDRPRRGGGGGVRGAVDSSGEAAATARRASALAHRCRAAARRSRRRGAST
jgi:hypothetical protein